MPEEVEIRPRAQGERIFVPYNVRAPKSGLESLAEVFQIGMKATETIVEIAEREESQRIAGALVDPTITDEALDRYADDARFNLTKVKIANRRGQVQFDRQRQEIDQQLREVTDPAEVRARLRGFKQQQLDQTADMSQQAGYMEAFTSYADQRIQKAHAEREAHLVAEDDALVGRSIQNAIENTPEEVGALFSEFFIEDAAFGDTGHLVGRWIDGLVSHALIDPENYDESIAGLEAMLDAGVIDDSQERRRVAEARNKLLAGKARADTKADEVSTELKKIEHGKAVQAYIKAVREGKPITEKHVDDLLRTADADDGFKIMGTIERFNKVDVQFEGYRSASRRDMNFWETEVRSGTMSVADILQKTGVANPEQINELLELHQSMQSGLNPSKSQIGRNEIGTLEEQLGLTIEDPEMADRAIMSEILNGFENWIATLPAEYSRPENADKLLAVAREKRRLLVDHAAAQSMKVLEADDEAAAMAQFRRNLDATFATQPHSDGPDSPFHGYVQ
jgi:hypothetical protein